MQRKFLIRAIIPILFFLFAANQFINYIQAEDLNSCLCTVACQNDNWNCSVVSCTYDPAGTGDYDCNDVSEGECLCSGFGCGRAPLPTGTEAQSCYEKYSPAIDGDNKCETEKGEDCASSASDCSCPKTHICNPIGEDSNINGCVPEIKCPKGSEFSSITGECFCERADHLLTDEGCITECPSGAFYSDTQKKCICGRIGYEIIENECRPSPDCPKNSTKNANDRCICNDGFEPNLEQTGCVKKLKDSTKFKLIMDKYFETIPEGIVDDGLYNNTLSFWDDKYDDFTCGGYQGKVLAFLDRMKFSGDPEERALLDHFDYGPIQSYFGGHQAVVIYPKGSNWIDDGIVLDPWPNQKPEAVTIQEWAMRFSLVDPLHSGTYIGISGSSTYETHNPKYPTVGGVYQNPDRSEAMSEARKKIFSGLTPGQKTRFKEMSRAEQDEFINIQLHRKKVRVYLYSPVELLIIDDNGNKLGESNGEIVKDIDSMLLGKVQESTGSFATLLEMPEGNYELQVKGTDYGDLTVLARIIDSNGLTKVYNAMLEISPDSDFIIDINYSEQTAKLNVEGEIIDLAEIESQEGLPYIPEVSGLNIVADPETWAEDNWADELASQCPEFAEYSEKEGKCVCKKGYEIDENGLCQFTGEANGKDEPIGGLLDPSLLALCALFCCCVIFLAFAGIIVIVVLRKRLSTHAANS